jgi:predicted dehydrogenase
VNIILLEVSHWHAPLYFDQIEAERGRVVGVSDRNREVTDAVAQRFRARGYGDWRELLAAERPDFAFAFGRHCEMAAIGETLVARGIPFLLEKPCGLTLEEVRRLRDSARSRGIFAAVPLVQSLGPLAGLIAEADRQPGPHHLWFRFIAGPPGRYPAAGSAWMLEPQQSGGGCFMNLSGHFIDLALRTLPGVQRVSARMSRAVYGEAIEDYAVATLEAPDGGSAVVETGYLYPSQAGRVREVYFSIFGRNGCRVWWGERGGRAHHNEPWAEEGVNLDSDPLYPRFVAATLAALREGRPAPVGLDAMVHVMEVVEAAYTSARTGQPVALGIAGYGGSNA